MERAGSRQVTIKSSVGSPSAAVPSVRVVTLHERFSQISSPPAVREEVRAVSSSSSSTRSPSSSARLNPHVEAGIRARRQATEIRQIAQRNEEVASARARPAAAAATWTPSFYDDDDDDGLAAEADRRRVPVVRPRYADEDDPGDDDAAPARPGRRVEFDGGGRVQEPEFIIKGIPPPQPRAGVRAQRTILVEQQTRYQPQQQARYQPRGTAPRGRGGSDRSVMSMPERTRGGRPQTRGGAAGSRSAQSVPGLRSVSPRGGRDARQDGGQRYQPRAAGPNGTRGRGRGGRGGATMASTRGGRAGGRGEGSKPTSKQDLDAELDSYMLKDAKSAKSYLDSELDDYMRVREQEGESA